MTSEMRITWTLAGSGWADCTLEDRQAKVELTASSITSAPEEFLTAVARLVAGEPDTRAQFEAELTAYRWIFYHEGVSDHVERAAGAAREIPRAGRAPRPYGPVGETMTRGFRRRRWAGRCRVRLRSAP